MRCIEFAVRILVATLGNGGVIRLVVERIKRFKVRLVDAKNLFLTESDRKSVV